MDSAGVQHHDRGAAAVEFALVSVLLFTLLFGIIQYGFLFFQYQAAAATAHEAARLAADGIDDACVTLGLAANDRGAANGLPANSVKEVDLDWTSLPSHGVTGEVTVMFEPTNFGMPFVPFPGTPWTAGPTHKVITIRVATTVEDVGAFTEDSCGWENHLVP